MRTFYFLVQFAIIMQFVSAVSHRPMRNFFKLHLVSSVSTFFEEGSTSRMLFEREKIPEAVFPIVNNDISMVDVNETPHNFINIYFVLRLIWWTRRMNQLSVRLKFKIIIRVNTQVSQLIYHQLKKTSQIKNKKNLLQKVTCFTQSPKTFLPTSHHQLKNRSPNLNCFLRWSPPCKLTRQWTDCWRSTKIK